MSVKTSHTTTYAPEELNTIRTVLSEIDNRLQGLDYKVRGGVIDVLTALRGPDIMSEDAVTHKERGTNWVRRAALPRTSGDSGNSGNSDNNAGRWSVGTYGNRPLIFYDADDDMWGHFNTHLEKACGALGLNWDEGLA